MSGSLLFAGVLAGLAAVDLAQSLCSRTDRVYVFVEGVHSGNCLKESIVTWAMPGALEAKARAKFERAAAKFLAANGSRTTIMRAEVAHWTPHTRLAMFVVPEHAPRTPSIYDYCTETTDASW